MQLPGKLTRLPKGFKKYTRDAIGKRIEEGGFDEGAKAHWREAIDRIDAYAESGEVKMTGFGT